MTTNELIQSIAIIVAATATLVTPVTVAVNAKVNAKKLLAERDFELEKIKLKESAFGENWKKEIETITSKLQDDIDVLEKMSAQDRQASSQALKLYEEIKKDFWELMKLVKEMIVRK